MCGTFLLFANYLRIGRGQSLLASMLKKDEEMKTIESSSKKFKKDVVVAVIGTPSYPDSRKDHTSVRRLFFSLS